MAIEIIEDTKENWDEMCEYVKKEILGYDDNMKFPKTLALKLRGMKNGQYIANNNIPKDAHYSNQCLLMTFKINKIYLKNILNNNKNIKDENHRINLMLRIIGDKLNDTYLKLKQIEQTNEIVENIDTGIFSSDGANYKSSSLSNDDDDKEKKAKARKENFAKNLL